MMRVETLVHNRMYEPWRGAAGRGNRRGTQNRRVLQHRPRGNHRFSSLSARVGAAHATADKNVTGPQSAAFSAQSRRATPALIRVATTACFVRHASLSAAPKNQMRSIAFATFVEMHDLEAPAK